MLNNACLMGRITKELDLKTTPNGKSVLNFSIALNRSHTKEKITDYVDIVAWGTTAQFVSKYFGKGSMIAIVGRLQSRNWEDKQGQKRQTLEVVAEQVSFTGEKSENPAPQESAPAPQDFEEISSEVETPF